MKAFRRSCRGRPTTERLLLEDAVGSIRDVLEEGQRAGALLPRVAVTDHPTRDPHGRARVAARNEPHRPEGAAPLLDLGRGTGIDIGGHHRPDGEDECDGRDDGPHVPAPRYVAQSSTRGQGPRVTSASARLQLPEASRHGLRPVEWTRIPLPPVARLLCARTGLAGDARARWSLRRLSCWRPSGWPSPPQTRGVGAHVIVGRSGGRPPGGIGAPWAGYPPGGCCHGWRGGGGWEGGGCHAGGAGGGGCHDGGGGPVGPVGPEVAGPDATPLTAAVVPAKEPAALAQGVAEAAGAVR